jgi:hypothetical protein
MEVNLNKGNYRKIFTLLVFPFSTLRKHNKKVETKAEWKEKA